MVLVDGYGHERFPSVIYPNDLYPGSDLQSLIFRMRSELEEALQERGAVIFRDFDIYDVQEFLSVCRAFSPVLLRYVGGGSPRTRIVDEVYTSTEYPPSLHIPLHNEASYFENIPRYVFFFCHTPAMCGGETPLGNMRTVLQKICTRVSETFLKHGLLYVSNLHNGPGFGKSWQATFETPDRDEVEQLLLKKGMEFAWQADGGLRIIMRGPAVRQHPVNRLLFWGNQAVNWHWATLPRATASALMHIYCDPWKFPKSVFLGNGVSIDPDDILHVKNILDQEERTFPWKPSDILVIDNHYVAHGRRPFSGIRKILVAMA